GFAQAAIERVCQDVHRQRTAEAVENLSRPVGTAVVDDDEAILELQLAHLCIELRQQPRQRGFFVVRGKNDPDHERTISDAAWDRRQASTRASPSRKGVCARKPSFSTAASMLPMRWVTKLCA